LDESDCFYSEFILLHFNKYELSLLVYSYLQHRNNLHRPLSNSRVLLFDNLLLHQVYLSFYQKRSLFKKSFLAYSSSGSYPRPQQQQSFYPQLPGNQQQYRPPPNQQPNYNSTTVIVQPSPTYGGGSGGGGGYGGQSGSSNKNLLVGAGLGLAGGTLLGGKIFKPIP
jgi:hypothetical protein